MVEAGENLENNSMVRKPHRRRRVTRTEEFIKQLIDVVDEIPSRPMESPALESNVDEKKIEIVSMKTSGTSPTP